MRPMEAFTPARVSVALISALILFMLGWYGSIFAHQYEEALCMQKYSLINAEIVCEDHDHAIDKANYTELKGEIERYIETLNADGVASHVSVYFRDLVNGPVMGINETEDFAPASLLKVPLAFVYLTREQMQPGFLDSLPLMQTIATATPPRTLEERIAHPTLRNLNQVFGPPEVIDPSKPYAVRDLLFRMLAYSDNLALDLLASYVENKMGGLQEIHSVFKELGLTENAGIAAETISVRGYASIFRALYHATYLNADLSQLVMHWLSQSSFDAGLEAGVPEGVVVAHKFGERDWSASNIHQLHDCGVVYFPDNPYLLCIMTQGASSKTLVPVIAEISRMVYEEVNSRRIMR